MLDRIMNLFRRQRLDPLMTDLFINQRLRKALESNNPKRRITALDLGQTFDFAALASLKAAEEEKAEQGRKKERLYLCDALYQWKTETAYNKIIDDLGQLYERPEMIDTELAVDYGGPGRPVIDEIRKQKIRCKLVPITITSGNQVTDGRGGARNVPKRVLATTLQLVYNSGRITTSNRLKWAKKLDEQLRTFTQKIRTQGVDSYEALREVDHDDLVLAVAMAVWMGEGGGKIKFNVFC